MSAAEGQEPDRYPVRKWSLAALGVVFTGASLAHFNAHPELNLGVLVATILPAVSLLAYGVWFGLQTPSPARGDVVFVWAVGGAGAVLALDLWALLVGAYGSAPWISHIFIHHSSMGALAGALVGTYSQRDEWRERSHLRLRGALDAAMDGVAVLDDAGDITYANHAFREYYDADEDDALLGEPWDRCYPANSRDHIGNVLDSLADAERSHWHGTVVARRAGGRTYPQELSLTGLENGGFVLVCRDVTGREKREQRLQVLNRVLRHNVRNSLNIVIGRANRLRERHGEIEDVESIIDAAEDVLDTSEKARLVERAFEEGEGNRESLEAIVASEVERARREYPEATYDTTLDCPAETDTRIRFAVRELLYNAAEHNDAENTRIWVTVEPDKSCYVSDNGSGIPEHERQALEGDQETQLDHGSGIGLWLVYWLVNQQNGAIDVTEGGGVSLHLDPGKS